MYVRYRKETVTDGSTRFVKVKEVSLFGCTNGYVPRLLAQHLGPTGRNQGRKFY